MVRRILRLLTICSLISLHLIFSDRARFVNGGGCYSNAGRIGGEQIVSIGVRCLSVRLCVINRMPCLITNIQFKAAVHEIGHALGFYHMHSRYDRDDAIIVNHDNISSVQSHELSYSRIYLQARALLVTTTKRLTLRATITIRPTSTEVRCSIKHRPEP